MSLKSKNQACIVVLSGHDEAHLKRYSEQIVDYLQKKTQSGEVPPLLTLTNVAYTLQVGRAHRTYRLAVIVNTFTELLDVLTRFIEGDKLDDTIVIKTKTSALDSYQAFEESEGQAFIAQLFEMNKLRQIADLWVNGLHIQWSALHKNNSLRRIPLPTAPFLGTRHWIEIQPPPSIPSLPKTPTVLHLYQSLWQPSEIPPGKSVTLHPILIFDIDDSLFRQLQQNTNHNGEPPQMILVKPGETYRRIDQRTFTLPPSDQDSYGQLFQALTDQKFEVQSILFRWYGPEASMEANRVLDAEPSSTDPFYQGAFIERGLHSVFNLVKSLLEKKIRSVAKLLFVFPQASLQFDPFVESVSGLTHSLPRIFPQLVLKTIHFYGDSFQAERTSAILKSELQTDDQPGMSEIRYQSGQRWIHTYAPIDFPSQTSLPLKENGNYLITGGGGALGQHFAEFIGKKSRSQIILLGRRPKTKKLEAKLRTWNQAGLKIDYYSADVTNLAQLSEIYQTIQATYGAIHGVIHAAGIMDEMPLPQKAWSQFQSILAPKMVGTYHLDQITKNDPLDFFLLFSSTSSLLGDFGQCDYATANRFMDGYSAYREQLRKQEKRQGQSIAINWPMWRDGGLRLEKDREQFYLKSSGIPLLESEAALQAFEAILASGLPQVAVIPGETARVQQMLGIHQSSQPVIPKRTEAPSQSAFSDIPTKTPETSQSLLEILKGELQSMVASILETPSQTIQFEENLGNYGLDSITLTQFAQQIEALYQIEVYPTIFFSYPCLDDLGNYLFDEFKSEIENHYLKGLPPTSDKMEGTFEIPAQSHKNEGSASHLSLSELDLTPPNTQQAAPHTEKTEGVAIIGASGIFPGSTNLDEFWNHLLNNDDLISEIPQDRWDWRQQEAASGGPVPKWGGFIEEIDQFDPLFFKISPREAEMMDPQHRLFLETVWNVFEDAGYRISEYSGKEVGVFIGLQSKDYEELLAEAKIVNAQLATGNEHAMLPNRVSFIFNFHGPSESVDTACSASLVALHRAVRSVQNGESDCAIAGGVSLILSPNNLMGTAQLGILSEDGRCKTFDQAANGYVKGEGIGAVLIKPLGQAMAHNDQIYAVIRGSGTRHGGKSNSLTAPNPHAQAELYRRVYHEANISPESISYIESHGTGTKLGDPIEIDGLKQVFAPTEDHSNSTPSQPYCGIGSVKTNMGHLEPAAGIAGILKALLAFKHKTLPANLHFKTVNPYLKLEGSPFYIIDQNIEWKPIQKPDGSYFPRRAGVSSFGFGGTYCHVLLEEYESQPRNLEPSSQHLIPVSAKTDEQLVRYLKKLTSFLKNKQDDTISLNDLAFTLQVGREAMEARIAFVVDTVQTLITAIEFYVVQGISNNNTYRGTAKPQNSRGQQTAPTELPTLAKNWVEGHTFDWTALFDHQNSQRISLPTYPFLRKRYWMNTSGLSETSTISDWQTQPQDVAVKTIKNTVVDTIENAAVDTIKEVDVEPFRKKFQPRPLQPIETLNLSHFILLNKPQGIRLTPLSIAPTLTEPSPEQSSPASPQRASLAHPSFTKPKPAVQSSMKTSKETLQKELTLSLAKALYLKPSEIEMDKPFVDMGLDSIIGVEWIQMVNKQYGLSIIATKVYDYPNVQEFAAFLAQELNQTAPSSEPEAIPIPIENPSQSSLEIMAPIAPDTSINKPSNSPSDSALSEMNELPNSASLEILEKELKISLAKALYFKPAEIQVDKPFVDMGLDSIIGVEWIQSVNKQYGLSIIATKVYDYPNVQEFAQFLDKELDSGKGKKVSPPKVLQEPPRPTTKVTIEPKPTKAATPPAPTKKTKPSSPNVQEPIAIVGMSGRYPGAKDLTQYWANLTNAQNSIQEIPQSRWNETDQIYCQWMGLLEDVDCFDPTFFMISPEEAKGMDPQHRIFLEEGYKAFEDAGYSSRALSNKKCGVYLGIMSHDYSILSLQNHIPMSGTSNSYSIGASRISYHLNLKGPAIPIDTACSSALVAMHLACQALTQGEIEMALVGGVTLYLIPESYVEMCSSKMLSREGQCKAFDNTADGFVPAEGAGAIVLKRLSDAERDKDPILGKIIGSGVNQDGKTNGITAPSAQSQMELERRIYQKYHIDPASITYVEAHGTGTKLGDSIELESLSTVFQENTDQKQYCALGSVKSNIGHTSAASGMASLHKVLLSLQHKELVPTINFKIPNQHFDFDTSPFYVNTERKPWTSEGKTPRRAAINSFGFSGTNAHVVIEEYLPVSEQAYASNQNDFSDSVMIVLSAKNRERLQAYAQNLLQFIEETEEAMPISLSNLAYTLQVGREAMEARLGLVVSTLAELKTHLRGFVESDQEDSLEAQENLYFGQTKQHKDTIAIFADEDLSKTIETWIHKGKYHPFLDLWVRGLNFDWNHFYQIYPAFAEGAQRIHVPTYPFAKERYWIDLQPPTRSTPPLSKAEVATETKTFDFNGDKHSTDSSLVTTVAWDFFLDSPSTKETSEKTTSVSLEKKTKLFLQQTLADQLQQPIDAIDPNHDYFEMGLTSHHLLKATQAIRNKIGYAFSPTAFYKYTPLSQLTTHLIENFSDAMGKLVMQRRKAQGPEIHSKQEFSETPPATSAAVDGVPVIIRKEADRYEPFPLNDLQESFLIGRQLGGSSRVGCHIYLEIEFDDHQAPLDIQRLNSAWNRLMEYHEMLRAVILPKGQQKILEGPCSYDFQTTDLRQAEPLEQAEHLQRVRNRMSHKVYEANQWPLFEIGISRGSHKTIVHFSIDEFIVDGFSMDMLFQQWKKLYHEPNSELPPLAISFRDYLLATKQFETTPYYQKDLDYWVQKLDAMSSGPQLPLNPKHDTPSQSKTGHRVRLEAVLEKDKWQRLRKRGEQLNVSPTVLLLSLFTEVIHQWSAVKGLPQERFTLILTFFNRLFHPQLDQILGQFISTNLFVAQKRETGDFVQSLQATQKELLEDLGHSHVSGIRVLRELKNHHKVPKSLALPVVFTSLLGNSNKKVNSEASFLEDVTFSVTQTPQVFLDHQVHEYQGELRFSWDVAEDYYDLSAIQDLFVYYGQVLQTLASSDKMSFPEYLEQRPQPFPLTDQQQAYAFGRSAYGAQTNSQAYLCFDAENLDLRRLEIAWRKVMEVHEMLVTVIHANGTQQVLEQIPPYPIKVTDLRGSSASRFQEKLSRLESSMISRVCPLGEWPYFELQVTYLDTVRSRLHFSIDLIIADWPSTDLVLNQLFYFYQNPMVLPQKNKISFSDYMGALQKLQQTEKAQTSLQYWKNKFATIPSGPELPEQTTKPTYKTERVEGILTDWTGLKAMAKQQSVPPNMVLLTAYAEVIAAWSASESFSIVIPGWERLPLYPEINEVVGEFASMSWLVVERTPKSFAEKVRYNHERVQDDLSHRAISGLQALRRVAGKNKGQKRLTFPVVFSDLNTTSSLQLPQGFAIGKTLSQTAQVHIDNISTERDGQLHLSWDVAQARFPQGMIQEMFAGYQRLLECLANDPNSWQNLHFDRLIHAQPKKYQARETKNTFQNSAIEMAV